MSTYVPIQAITLSAATTSITFTGIPQTYTDLVIVFEGTANGSNAKTIKFNNDTGANYSCTVIYGTGSSAASGRYTDSYLDVVNSFANRQATIVQVSNYSNTTTNKTYLSRHTCAASSTEAIVGLWRNTAAINTITINTSTANTFNTGSTFTLYGIGSGAPKAFGGSTVTTDGTYWYHAFRSSSRFESIQTLNCDILVVAGGGGGNLSSASAGGAGAGGLLTFTSQSIVAGIHTVTVGAGGVGTISASGSYSATSNGTSGNNSRFGSLTAAVGGGLGGGYTSPGGNTGWAGGSGGGGATNAGAGGAATSGQGFAGGSAGTDGNFYSGGGGGAGAAGGSGNSGLAAGGIGATSALITAMGNATNTGTLSSNNRYFAGGGGGSSNGVGGGAGGLGGGGQGATANNLGGSSGTANTGGGAGGGSNTQATAVTGGNGGSGIVIVRYLV